MGLLKAIKPAVQYFPFHKNSSGKVWAGSQREDARVGTHGCAQGREGSRRAKALAASQGCVLISALIGGGRELETQCPWKEEHNSRWPCPFRWGHWGNKDRRCRPPACRARPHSPVHAALSLAQMLQLLPHVLEELFFPWAHALSTHGWHFPHG